MCIRDSQQPLLWGWESLLLPPQPPGALSIRGLRLYFPELEPAVVRFICGWMWCRRVLPATLSPALSVYLHKCRATGSASARTACPVCPTLRQSQSHHGNVSPLHPGARLRSSYQSGWMFILFFLGVGPPCRSIFCQFWLCEEAQCVYLRCHLGSLWCHCFYSDSSRAISHTK